MTGILTNRRIKSRRTPPSPNEVKQELPISEGAQELVLSSRKQIEDILDRKDPRIMIWAGPCSLDDEKANIELAQHMKELADKVKDKFLILLRGYGEKPRTNIGWKGMMHDPDRDGSYNTETGIIRIRRLYNEFLGIGQPLVTEFLHPLFPQYIDDQVSGSAIGARTVESQTHREMASGLSMPVAFKNNTQGDIKAAVDAIIAARSKHYDFPGSTGLGKHAFFETTGNPYCFVCLRGGNGKPHCNPSDLEAAIEVLESAGTAPTVLRFLKGENGPNYHKEDVAYTARLMEEAGLVPNIMIDINHGNSKKRLDVPFQIMHNALNQRRAGNPNIVGIMSEVNLYKGNQPIDGDKYGVSRTDPCSSFEEFETAVLHEYELMKAKE